MVDRFARRPPTTAGPSITSRAWTTRKARRSSRHSRCGATPTRSGTGSGYMALTASYAAANEFWPSAAAPHPTMGRASSWPARATLTALPTNKEAPSCPCPTEPGSTGGNRKFAGDVAIADLPRRQPTDCRPGTKIVCRKAPRTPVRPARRGCSGAGAPGCGVHPVALKSPTPWTRPPTTCRPRPLYRHLQRDVRSS